MINMKNKFWVALGIVAFSFILPQSVLAAIGDIPQSLAEVLFNILLTPFVLILKLELLLLPKIATYNGFTRQEGVVQGWTILRDLANMFFIIVLLVIAFATILRVKSYGFKQLLSNFIIVVILVNFSRTIIGLVIDLFQVVMLTFVSAIKDVLAGNIVVALGLHNLMTFSDSGAGSITSGDFLAAVFFGGIMLIVACVVIGIFIFTLAMRIITIWLLVVSAPMAFLAYVVPRTQSYFNRWVDKLLNAILVGPVIAFLLWLSFTIVGSGKIHESFQNYEGGQEVTDQDLGNVAEVATTENVITYVIGIAMLFGSLLAAKNLGTVGAGIGSKAAQKLQSVGTRAALWTPRTAWQGTSGQGMLKGGLSVTRGAIGSSMASGALGGMAAKIPILGRSTQQAGLRMQAKETVRRQAKQAYLEKGTAGMSDEQKMQYYKSFDSFGAIGRREAKISNAQLMVDRGLIKDNQQATLISGILRQANDGERLKRLQLTRADAFGSTEEIHKAIQEKGPGILSPRHEINSIAEPVYEKDAAGKIKTDADGKNIIKKDADGNDMYQPTGGAKLIAKEIIENEHIGGEELTKAIAALPPKVQDIWMSVFREIGTDVQKAFKEGADGKRSFNSDSSAGKQITIGMQNAPQQFVQVFKTIQNISPTDANELFNKISKGMDFGKLSKLDLKIDAQREMFTRFAINANNAQQRQLFDKGSEEQIKLMVETLEKQNKSVNNILRDYKKNKGVSSGGDDYDAQQGMPT